jgi:nucleotidyltransferase/DNA polymerase involved in DNA repair
MAGWCWRHPPWPRKLYGISNVNRQRDLPRDNHLIVVPPRMNTYIEKNIEVNNIYREFVADEDLLPYSIDESILDITHSWKLFGDDPIESLKRFKRPFMTAEAGYHGRRGRESAAGQDRVGRLCQA